MAEVPSDWDGPEMSKYDCDYIMSLQVFTRIMHEQGFIGIWCPTCNEPIKVGQRVYSKPSKGKGRYGTGRRRTMRRHYSCAQRVNVI